MASKQQLSFDRDATPKVLQLYLELAQYPILGRRIVQRMREEIFRRGVVDPRTFEEEVRDKAQWSQIREGLQNPVLEETAEVWKLRLEKIAELVTVFYFAHNLPHDLFLNIVTDLTGDAVLGAHVPLSFNPELAPWSLLFEQGEIYESYPPDERKLIDHHLKEIIVVIVKTMISDHLTFIRVAREHFTIADLTEIRARRIGRGKIGGKAAGMLLAYKILQHQAEEKGLDLANYLTIPDSYYIAADVYYDFKSENGFFESGSQKYKDSDQIKADYPEIRDLYARARLPEYVCERLVELLDSVGKAPLIVRSSSLLEDNFDTSFAGKYDSVFLPNQGTPEENLAALQHAITQVYASILGPEALIYRQRMGLIDYDERMGVLIQKVEGEQYGRYFFPSFAGVGFGHNPYRWSKRIRPEEGLLRIVTGLGTRAVDRVAQDYPRMVALSHPELRPEGSTTMVRHYSQHAMDVIDLEANTFSTLPVGEVLKADYPGLGAIMSVDRGGYLQPLPALILSPGDMDMVVTLDRLLGAGRFIDAMRDSMNLLEEAYGRPVDMEFAGEVTGLRPYLTFQISLLQCRPQSRRSEVKPRDLPTNLDDEDILFTANQQIPQGYVEDIRYIVYVDPRQYARIADAITRIEIGKLVGKLNERLEGEGFILMGPGRWGTSNIQLGVRVTYTDIYNTRMLIEIAFSENGSTPEVSYGTHFFQDLVEANIYPLPLYPGDPGVVFHEDFFQESPNMLPDLLPQANGYEEYIRVIDLVAVTGKTLTIIMSSEEEQAIAYLVEPARTSN